MATKQDWVEAMAALEAVQKERDAMVAPTNSRMAAAETRLSEIEDELPDGHDLIDQCEGCSTPIFEGEKYYYCVDSIYLCEACSPTYDMLLTEPEFFVNEDEGPLGAEKARAIYDEHLAAGGKPTDSMARI